MMSRLNADAHLIVENVVLKKNEIMICVNKNIYIYIYIYINKTFCMQRRL